VGEWAWVIGSTGGIAVERPVPGRLEDVSDKEMPEQERAWLADLGSGQPEDAGNQHWLGRPQVSALVIGDRVGARAGLSRP
jgi:hypothetical protein